MGSGIAQVCAQAGIQVALHDVSKDALEKALKGIDWSVGKFVEKGKLTEDREVIINRIKLIAELNAASKVDLAIEAVFESIELKRDIFQKLDRICPPETLIASNTSAIPITELAAVTKRPERVLGLHFFQPGTNDASR